MRGVGTDLLRAARSLGRNRGFTIVAVAMLALGIGAVVSIFTVLERVVLRPLPYPEADRLVWIESRVPGSNPDEIWGLSQAGYLFFQEESRTLEAMGATNNVWGQISVTLSREDGSDRVTAAEVGATLLPLLGASPVVGRLFDGGDDVPGGPPILVLSHELWQAMFGGDPSVIGRTIVADGVPHEIIGVMAAGVHLPREQVGIWRPLRMDPALPPENDHWVGALARLRPGSSPADAEAELARLTERLPEVFPSAYWEDWMRNMGFATRVVPLRDHVIGNVGSLLWALFAAVGLVLLIAFANVANLFLVRTESRRREMAIRTAMGAGPGHLVRQWLGESALVAGGAAGAGLALATLGLSVLTGLAPAGIPRLTELGIGWTAVGFAALVGLAVALVLGLLPLVWARIDMTLLRDGHGQTAARGRHVFRRTLVIGQLALAFVLLAAAGATLRSSHQLQSVPPGFDARNVLTFQLALPQARYGEDAAHVRYYRELTDRVEALPEVIRAGGATRLPMQASDGCFQIYIEDRVHPTGAPVPCVLLLGASPGHLESLGIPVQGQTPSWSDLDRGSDGIVITRALADRFWPGEDPIGKGLHGWSWGGQPVYRVAGVTGQLRNEGLDRGPTEAVYMPLVPIRAGTAHWGPYWGNERELFMTVKTATDAPESLMPAIRSIVTDIDPGIAISNVATMETLIARSDSVARIALMLLLLGLAATIALVLSGIGLYAVISFIVGQRTREIGVRMALGARTEQVAGVVLRESFVLAGVGLGAGLAITFAVTRVLRTLLFEARALDPLTLGSVTLLLVGIALSAAYLPARRASRVDPVRVLR